MKNTNNPTQSVEEIKKYPLSLRTLGKWLTEKLNDDDWNNVEPMLHKIGSDFTKAKEEARATLTDEMVERLKEDVINTYEVWRTEHEQGRFEEESISFFTLGYRLRCCFEDQAQTIIREVSKSV